MRRSLTEDNGGRLNNIVDRLKLDINTVGCQLSGLSVRRSRETEGPGFESYVRRSSLYTAEEYYTRTERPSSSSRFFVMI